MSFVKYLADYFCIQKGRALMKWISQKLYFIWENSASHDKRALKKDPLTLFYTVSLCPFSHRIETNGLAISIRRITFTNKELFNKLSKKTLAYQIVSRNYLVWFKFCQSMPFQFSAISTYKKIADVFCCFLKGIA